MNQGSSDISFLIPIHKYMMDGCRIVGNLFSITWIMFILVSEHNYIELNKNERNWKGLVSSTYIPINLLFVRSQVFLAAGWEPTSSENQPCLSVYLSKHVGSFALASVWLSYLTLILFYFLNLGITYIFSLVMYKLVIHSLNLMMNIE